MANNITTGPNARIAKADQALNQMGLTPQNTEIVYEAEGSYKSWKPGRTINGVNNIVSGNGYIIIAKQEMDLNQYFGATTDESTLPFTLA